MGRRDKRVPRDHIVSLRVSDEEMKQIDQISAGVRRSDILRAAIKKYVLRAGHVGSVAGGAA